MSIMQNIKMNYGLLADTDSYKLSHPGTYPAGSERMMSYIESRGGKYDKVVWFGLQLIIKEHLMRPITQRQVETMMEFVHAHMGGNWPNELEESFRVIVDEYDGVLPIRIRAAEEGSVIPVGNVLATIETTVDDPRIFSIVSYLETRLLRVWSPTTVATISYHVREDIYKALERTADDPDAEIAFKLHDFGARGATSSEQAAFAGAGHLVSFMGSDTILGILAAKEGYGGEIPAFSIPASEHSTTTSWGVGGEETFLENIFSKYAKEGALFATVADSYDIKHFVEDIAPRFKEKLIESGAIWVVRPDSGDPVTTPVMVIKALDESFGSTVNSKGFKVLNNVRVIQGDGMNPQTIKELLFKVEEAGYSISNIAFGMGGGLLQKNDRDTLRFAMKACAIKIDGEWEQVYKSPTEYKEGWEPVEGNSKKSKAGRLTLLRDWDGSYHTVNLETRVTPRYDDMEEVLFTVFENGHLCKELTFDQVRRNAGTIM